MFAEPGDTILHLVSRNYIPNKLDFGEMLLRLGSNIEATNDSGHKAMDVSRHNSIEFEPMVPDEPEPPVPLDPRMCATTAELQAMVDSLATVDIHG